MPAPRRLPERAPVGAEASGNGRHPKSGLGRRLHALRLARPAGTDEIDIGAVFPVPGGEEEAEGATMAEAAEVVAGVKYLLKGWIPFGMVTGIVAEPGVGKSAFCLYGIVRAILAGADWFDGAPGSPEPGHVLWCGTENDLAITVKRMRDWAIPMDRLILPFKADPLASVNLADDAHVKRVEALVNRYRPKAVVIDSLRGAHDGDENCSRVGRVLQSLGGIAERTRAALIVVHHTRKLMVDEEITANSSRGSNAILAMMRAQIGIDKPDPESKWCRVRVLKENLGLAPKPVGFRVTATGLEFGPPPEKPRKETRKQGAEDCLRGYMEPGRWYPSKEIDEAARRFKLSDNAVQRAKEALGIVGPKYVRKTKGGWECMLPLPLGEEPLVCGNP